MRWQLHRGGLGRCLAAARSGFFWLRAINLWRFLFWRARIAVALWHRSGSAEGGGRLSPTEGTVVYVVFTARYVEQYEQHPCSNDMCAFTNRIVVKCFRVGGPHTDQLIPFSFHCGLPTLNVESHREHIESNESTSRSSLFSRADQATSLGDSQCHSWPASRHRCESHRR